MKKQRRPVGTAISWTVVSGYSRMSVQTAAEHPDTPDSVKERRTTWLSYRNAF